MSLLSVFIASVLLVGFPLAGAEEEGRCSGESFDEVVAERNESIICEFGCFDSEDEACHKGLSQEGCAEIYGHVVWAKRCNCKTENGTEISQRSAELEPAEVSLYFSVPAFIVLFRESLEVVIVLAIILQFLTKAKDDGSISEELFKQLRREVYVGATCGFIICLVIGVGFIALASLARGLFKCENLLVFDGCIMLLTTIVLTFLALNFYKMIYSKEAHELKMKRQIDAQIAAAQDGEGDGASQFGKKHAFLIFAFSTGLREGMESIIFLVGVISDFKDPSYVTSLPLPIISALVLSRIVGCIFFQGTKRMNVDNFMRFCSIFLLFVAAGFFTSSMHKWQELEVFGTWSPRSERPWQNVEVWDATDCCNDKTSRFWVLMRALLGWQDQPTPVEFFAWFLYWVVAISLGIWLVRRAIKQMSKRIVELRASVNDDKVADEASDPKEEAASVTGEC